MMEERSQSGTGTAAQIPGVPVAGKTGTAETGVAGPLHDLVHRFAPANAPRVAVAVVLENQTGVGGQVAAPIAKHIMEALLAGGANPNLVTTCRPPTPSSTVFDGRYRIIRKLGAGGMADVYLAEDQELGRRVAIKILNDRHAPTSSSSSASGARRRTRPASRTRTSSRSTTAARPRAPTTSRWSTSTGGRSRSSSSAAGPRRSRRRSTTRGRSSPRSASRTGTGSSTATSSRTTSSSAPDGRLKVTDFGIARSGASQMTEAGSIIGTAQYLSPEQARGAPVDQRSDLYSVGIVLYEMLTGQVPFTGDTPLEIAMKHLSEVPEPPSELRPEVPHDLDSIVLRALAKDPDDRYQSAEEMDADLARVARGAAGRPRDGGGRDGGARGPGASQQRRPPDHEADGRRAADGAAGRRAAGRLLRLRGAASATAADLALAARDPAAAGARCGGLVRLHEDPGPAGRERAGRGAAR